MKRNKKVYAMVAAGLLFFVITACFLPQIVFQIQDTYWSENTFSEVRNGLDIEKLNISYERALKTRLSNFAQKDISSYYVAEMSAAIDDSAYEMLDTLLYQDMLLIMTQSMGFLPIVYEDYSIDVLKKYVIYNDDYDQGIALIAWYIEYTTERGSKIQILADAETETVYYLNGSVGIDNAYSDVQYLRQDFLDYTNEWIYYVVDYFQSATNAIEEQAEESYENAVNSSVLTYYNDTLPERNEIDIPLVYDDCSLDFQILFSDNKDGSYQYSLGVEQIKNLIPELQTQ